MTDEWKELDLGGRLRREVDRLAKSGNGIVMFGNHEVNVGPLTDDVKGEEILLEKSTVNFGVCLTEKFREDDYLENHPIGHVDFHYRPGDESEYKKWIGGNPHPPPREVFAAEIDRFGRSDGELSIQGWVTILL
jgi:hypothetical protein